MKTAGSILHADDSIIPAPAGGVAGPWALRSSGNSRSRSSSEPSSAACTPGPSRSTSSATRAASSGAAASRHGASAKASLTRLFILRAAWHAHRLPSHRRIGVADALGRRPSERNIIAARFIGVRTPVRWPARSFPHLRTHAIRKRPSEPFWARQIDDPTPNPPTPPPHPRSCLLEAVRGNNRPVQRAENPDLLTPTAKKARKAPSTRNISRTCAT